MTQDLCHEDLRHPEMCNLTLQEFSLYVSVRAIRHFSVQCPVSVQESERAGEVAC